jgi:hypothetical protein
MRAGKRLSLGVWLGIVFLVAVITFFGLNLQPSATAPNTKLLADGSTLELHAIALTNDYKYSHQATTRWQKLFSPLKYVLPDRIKNRLFFTGGGGFGFGTSGDTNLFIITVNRGSALGWSSSLMRLVVFDDQGNTYDACWGASTLMMGSEVVHGWQIRAFPRRSQKLGLRFLKLGQGTQWEIATEFVIPNPGYGQHPQWQPEALPITHMVEDWSVTLKEFVSGENTRLHRNIGGHEKVLPRQTRVAFEFRQQGELATNWAVQKINLSDATGNRWFPYMASGMNWSEQGETGFLGALWPGEQAWKLEAEFVRTSGFSEAELWTLPAIPIPTTGVVTNLNLSTERAGDKAELVGIGAPMAEHPEPFKWIAKYWGQVGEDKVITLTAKFKKQQASSRLKLVEAVDQNGNPAQLISHNNEDYPEQAFLVMVADGAKELRLTLALQQSRTVSFMARPDFVLTTSTNTPVVK